MINYIVFNKNFIYFAYLGMSHWIHYNKLYLLTNQDNKYRRIVVLGLYNFWKKIKINLLFWVIDFDIFSPLSNFITYSTGWRTCWFSPSWPSTINYNNNNNSLYYSFEQSPREKIYLDNWYLLHMLVYPLNCQHIIIL